MGHIVMSCTSYGSCERSSMVAAARRCSVHPGGMYDIAAVKHSSILRADSFFSADQGYLLAL
jgi:hypothetical protein